MRPRDYNTDTDVGSLRLNFFSQPELSPSRITVINLPDRLDRRARVEQLFRQEGIPFQFSDGVRVELNEILPKEYAKVEWADKKHLDRDTYLRGLVGCKRAHHRCLEEARSKRLESLLIMEDDVAFRADWREPLMTAISELPDGWVQLYFSGYPFNPPERVDGHLLRLSGAWQTTAILYSRRGIEIAAECIESAQCELDHWMAIKLHPLGNSYMVDPQITYQIVGFSDCRGEFRGELH
jgi:Glycosyltransferase family 25 (LPS biosynthesis protein)